MYYEALREWIAAGAQLNLTSPRVTAIKVTPNNPVIESIGARQQVRVVATYTDGSERDVTREAFVESGNTDVVKTVPDHPGLLESLRRGEAAALVRYEGKYAATTLTVMGDRSGFAWDRSAGQQPHRRTGRRQAATDQNAASPLTNDYEFVRRVYLDLTGLPPTPEQIQAFVDDKARHEGKARCARRQARRQRRLHRFLDQQVGRPVDGQPQVSWASKARRRSAAGSAAKSPPTRRTTSSPARSSRPAARPKTNPAASYFKTLRTPEALMENTTHLFLATRFNCNKCHDHPFERWTQDQYYHLSAYFAQIDRTKDPASGDRVIGGSAVEAGQPLYEIVADAGKGEVKHVRTGAVSPPAFPFDAKHERKKDESRREELAAWITSPDNPYFAKSYVNRLWGYLTGRGIIEPLDDIRAGNPPRIPSCSTTSPASSSRATSTRGT